MAILSSIFVIVRRTKFVFEIEQEFDGSNSYMKFGRHQMKNDYVRVTTTADTDRRRPFCQPSCLSIVRHNPYSNLFDESNPYMKFEKNPIKNDKVRVTTTAYIDWRRPSWLSDVGQNPYSNLNERLMEATHI